MTGRPHRKVLKPVQKRNLVDRFDAACRIGMRRACDVVGCCRSAYFYTSVKDGMVLRQLSREIAEVRVRYGYLLIHMLLRREGWHVKHKRVYRISREEGLKLRHKHPRRRVTATRRIKRHELSSIDQCWSMDFVANNLFNGRRIRALTVVNKLSRECLVIHVEKAIKGRGIVTVMERLRLLGIAVLIAFWSTTATS